jgi:hypothetical protein
MGTQKSFEELQGYAGLQLVIPGIDAEDGLVELKCIWWNLV